MNERQHSDADRPRESARGRAGGPRRVAGRGGCPRDGPAAQARTLAARSRGAALRRYHSHGARSRRARAGGAEAARGRRPVPRLPVRPRPLVRPPADRGERAWSSTSARATPSPPGGAVATWRGRWWLVAALRTSAVPAPDSTAYERNGGAVGDHARGAGQRLVAVPAPSPSPTSEAGARETRPPTVLGRRLCSPTPRRRGLLSPPPAARRRWSRAGRARRPGHPGAWRSGGWRCPGPGECARDRWRSGRAGAARRSHGRGRRAGHRRVRSPRGEGGVGREAMNDPMQRRWPMHRSCRCGARTRSGNPCRSPAVRGRARCRMHGGAAGSGARLGNANALRHAAARPRP
jgi:hypothetical protein